MFSIVYNCSSLFVSNIVCFRLFFCVLILQRISKHEVKSLLEREAIPLNCMKWMGLFLKSVNTPFDFSMQYTSWRSNGQIPGIVLGVFRNMCTARSSILGYRLYYLIQIVIRNLTFPEFFFYHLTVKKSNSILNILVIENNLKIRNIYNNRLIIKKLQVVDIHETSF